MPRHDFIIPQVPVDVKEESTSINPNGKPKEKENYVPEHFVSSRSGTNVSDKQYFPHVGYGNSGRQFDSFRDKEKRMFDDSNVYMSKRSTPFKPQEEVKPVYQQQEPVFENSYVEKETQNEDYNDAGYDDSFFGYEKEKEVVNYPKEENNSFNPIYDDSVEMQEEYHDEVDEETAEEIRSYQEEQIKAKRINHKETNSDKQVTIKKEPKSKYVFPPIDLLNKKTDSGENYSGVQKQRDIIDKTLQDFGVSGRVTAFTKGPTVTLFEVELDPGVKYQRVSQLSDNLQGNLEAVSIRIEAPIPGKARVGIEVPNIDRDMVLCGDMLANDEFRNDGNPLNVVLGLDVSGNQVFLDITKMPHGLIAGCTGSGKSVCINSLLISILYKAHPDDVKLILIDPKKVEFSKFRGIPHLATPIITDSKLAVASLNWAVEEMENRYELFASVGASKYTEYLEFTGQNKDTKHLPYIVIIIDEFADLIQTNADVETSISRLTAKARAAGIHLLVCTQRPSANVINGTIKTNIPARIAFKVNNGINSNIIIDRMGAEKLLGNGDMLYIEETGRERRIQGAFVSGTEIMNVVRFITDHCESEFMIDKEELTSHDEQMMASADDVANDDLFEKIARYVVDTQNASINKLQKTFGCGFNRMQGIIQKLEDLGIVSENLGSRARSVLVTPEELDDILENL